MKSIKITPPEGYEIDRESSTLECVKFKPIHNPTYKDISDILFNRDIVDYYRINNMGKINKYISHVTTFNGDIDFYFRKNIALYEKQLEGILALNQLRNISIYYNRKHLSTNDHYYTIVYSRIDDSYCVFPINMDYRSSTDVIFNQKEDVEEVIHNPNFRTILDTVYK